ncbi:hypothetical protein Rhow_003677 [Rhodococcus wratislaviensis]|uniref:Uncharacterized protein n=1 Tax=Rhodococcus wratislaviensis TaxID=44752 RepID=A0A402C8U9_RHOWR|nr:hypothetical protein Rhow_003677 [Rhodococcus wratislaviensis]
MGRAAGLTVPPVASSAPPPARPPCTPELSDDGHRTCRRRCADITTAPAAGCERRHRTLTGVNPDETRRSAP